MTQPTEFLPGIFVGDQWTAANEIFFKDNNIKKVVNCTSTLPFYFPLFAKYVRIPVDDAADEVSNNMMAAYIPSVIDFILTPLPSKATGGVLIHCQAGVSRSCTVAVAVLRYCCSKTIKEAVNILRMKRDIAFFWGFYMNFERALYNVFTK
jgi:protein tyrosine phosphatase